MKKNVCLLLAITLLLLTLTSCGESKKADNGGEKTAALDILTAEKLAALPVPSDKMSKAELRQLCIDYFTLQVSFQWTSNMDITDWQYTHLKGYPEKTIMKDNIYGGIPYQSLGNGNLYRWLEYTDQKTGMMDTKEQREGKR